MVTSRIEAKNKLQKMFIEGATQEDFFAYVDTILWEREVKIREMQDKLDEITNLLIPEDREIPKGTRA